MLSSPCWGISLIAMCVALWSCQNQRTDDGYEQEPSGEISSGGQRQAQRTEQPVSQERVVVRANGPLRRAEVLAIVQAGLGSVFSRVEISPVFTNGQFSGFRLDRALDLESWRSAGADMRVGDVIVRVNGIRIERPIHALRAFELLGTSQAIDVQIVREGMPMTIHVPIVQ